jgi:hypothetical protein
MQLTEMQVLKLPKDDREVSKHVGVNIIETENVVIYICALVGWNKNNIQMHGTFIKI